MRAWINLVGWILLAALLAMVGVWLGQEPGQVEIRWLGYQIRTTMAFLLLGVVLLGVLVWVLDGLLRRFPRQWRQRSAQARRATLRRAWTCLGEGRLLAARKLFLKASALPEQRALALHGAALAAVAAEEPGVADELWGSLTRSPVAAAARAEFARRQLQAGHPQAAEAALQDLDVPAERLVWLEALGASGRAAEALAAWPAVTALKLPCRERLERLRLALLQQATASSARAADLAQIWDSLDRAHQRQPAFVVPVLVAALRLDCADAYSSAAQEAYDTEPNALLAAWWGLLPHTDLRAALKRVERWRERHPECPGLHLALVRLCRRLALWGKGLELLQQGVAAAPGGSAELWEELGLWAREQGDFRLATAALLNALRLRAGLPPVAVELPSRPAAAAGANAPATDSDPHAGAGGEARGMYGFPLLPGS